MSGYAATSPMEDFAETFMIYVRSMGELPERYDNAAIRRKWAFIRRLGKSVEKGLRAWD